jgi:hypothetical protein
MKLENEILINKFGQDLVNVESILKVFDVEMFSQKKLILNDLIFLVIQSKAKDEDINQAIKESKLKESYTPCVLLKKGVANHNLQKLISLPDSELEKTFILLLHLYRIAYKRRFEIEKNNPNKWWYWDLSDDEKVKFILNR